MLAKDFLPSHITRAELGSRGVAAIGAAKGRTYSKTTLRKIQSIADLAPHAIIFNPADEGLIHAALVEQIFQQSPNGIICDGGNNGGIQAKAALQAASYVVLATALRNMKRTSRPDSVITGIEPQHHLAQAHQVPLGSGFWLDGQH